MLQSLLSFNDLFVQDEAKRKAICYYGQVLIFSRLAL